MMQKHGTVWFRNFDLMKTPEGFRAMWEAIGPRRLDPIHTSGLRKFLSKSVRVYEEVNKQSLSKHYIGLHNESSEKKSATYGAFVCFMPATVSGGEFLIADGEKILRDIPTDVLTKLYDEKVRISVANLDLDVLDAVPGDFKGQAMDFAKAKIGEKVAPKFDMDLEMVWGTDGKDMRLQAIEPTQSPINRHPKTGRPVWFCNMHKGARFLRDRRARRPRGGDDRRLLRRPRHDPRRAVQRRQRGVREEHRQGADEGGRRPPHRQLPRATAATSSRATASTPSRGSPTSPRSSARCRSRATCSTPSSTSSWRGDYAVEIGREGLMGGDRQ